MEKKKRYTEAQARACKKYLATKAEYKIRMSEETKEEIKKYAETANKSMNQFILDAVDHEIDVINKNRG